MSFLLNPNLWLLAGIALVLAEFIVPGGVVVFLGLACLVVAAAISLGLVSSWVTTLTLFFVTSLLLILILRSFFMKFAGGDFSRGNTIEILDDIGQTVTVIKRIGPGQKRGLIEYNGTQWKAFSDGQTIEAGERVQIVGRDNVSYIVEPLPDNVPALNDE